MAPCWLGKKIRTNFIRGERSVVAFNALYLFWPHIERWWRPADSALEARRRSAAVETDVTFGLDSFFNLSDYSGLEFACRPLDHELMLHPGWPKMGLLLCEMATLFRALQRTGHETRVTAVDKDLRWHVVGRDARIVKFNLLFLNGSLTQIKFIGFPCFAGLEVLKIEFRKSTRYSV